ncbi:outer membrane beta-barrel protein [Paraflavitalea sp. CAU 1676]|uniref:outer membrane beta-barrel protein n=1 Tax=Paraflavitalea sp. CAU 1676 TaxID=3032598 RepID=UPI0023DAF9CE|nr:outer membrane beta-barrel protein [Paraflavitalea sp. CAU 1676]MDF2192948.1 TonB-dependent receptor [Paraflavitalea sp. CAU 1676]
MWNKCLLTVLSILTCALLCAQSARLRISGSVTDSLGQQLPAVTALLLKASDSSTVKLTSTDNTGQFAFEDMLPGQYLLSFSATGFVQRWVLLPALTASHTTAPIQLTRSATLLSGVTVVARKPLIELRPDKTVVNVDAAVTNVGATALEVLEKSPGVTVDRNGTISLKGKANVLILMDGKQTFLPAADLASYLNGLSASQLEQIEIMTNPSAKYDAAGSTGIINIKTKKNKVKGFNGTLNLAYGQGTYYKSNNSLLLNFRDGNFNLYLNYSTNINKSFTDIYAYRWYYKADNSTVTNRFEQPTSIVSPVVAQNFKTGIDYYLGKKTTLGASVAGLGSRRKTFGNSYGEWINNNDHADSLIVTASDNKSNWNNLGLNFNARHTFSAGKELSADFDYLAYDIENYQFYQNTLTGNNNYVDGLRGDLPSTLHIYSGKADYAQSIGKHAKVETGWKSSYVKTDNLARYETFNNNTWKPDYDKTNHFLYAETIHALYGNSQFETGKWSLQGGLRFEHTAYDADQLGNPTRKDSSFSRQYSSLFPTGFASYQADSSHSFSLSAGRRIDRPAFQKLNPFVFVINKYTYQTGNPYFRPQFTWNFEFSHMYKQQLMTTLSYSVTKDYFSQIFYSDSNNLIIYTEGNLGRMVNIGLSVSSQLSPASWWSVTMQANLNHKKIEGVVVNPIRSSITQLYFNVNNQFKFIKGWSAELSGYYITKAQNDLQEVLDPAGQLAAGISKQLFKNKATVKLSVRDIFYTQIMAGWTDFQQSREYFKLTRDSRVATVAFTWRFGKPLKSNGRKAGSASDEIKERVGQN